MVAINSWEEFFKTVEKMRIAQKKFFRSHSKAVMAESIVLEEAIDAFIVDRNKRMAEKIQPTLLEGGK